MRRSVIDAVGPFHEGLIQLQDYDYWLRAAGQGYRLGLFDHRIVAYRRHTGNLSAATRDLATRTEIPIVLESVLQTARPSVLRQTFPEFTQPVADPEAPLNLFEQSAVLLAHPRQEVKMRGLTKAIAFARTRRAPPPAPSRTCSATSTTPATPSVESVYGLARRAGQARKDVISLATAPLNGKRNLDVRRCHQPSCPRPPLMVGSDSACATQDERLPRRYFALCIALYVCYLLAMQPALLLDGEMWAEMATNYYANAQAPSLVARLMSTDAGYIPLPQRLLALLFHALALPASSIPYAYSWTAILLTAAMVGSFCLGPFRRVVQSDGLRLLVALSVLALADYETRTFINFTYFAAFFILILSALALVSDKMDAPPGWAWLTRFS